MRMVTLPFVFSLEDACLFPFLDFFLPMSDSCIDSIWFQALKVKKLHKKGGFFLLLSVPRLV